MRASGPWTYHFNQTCVLLTSLFECVDHVAAETRRFAAAAVTWCSPAALVAVVSPTGSRTPPANAETTTPCCCCCCCCSTWFHAEPYRGRHSKAGRCSDLREVALILTHVLGCCCAWPMRWTQTVDGCCRPSPAEAGQFRNHVW